MDRRSPGKGAGRLNHHQRIAWLRLIRSENVGPATFRALVNEFGGAGISQVRKNKYSDKACAERKTFPNL